MIRRSGPEVYQLSPGRPLWVPEIDPDQEESFGPFRDTWLLTYVDRDEALKCLADEARSIARVSELSSDDISFETACLAIEHDDDEADEPNREWCYGLDIGVAGLVYALNALGVPTAVSCRGHVELPGRPVVWSEWPLIQFATGDQEFVQHLVGLSRECGVGFMQESSGLLTLWASSIEDTHSLAGHLLASLSDGSN